MSGCGFRAFAELQFEMPKWWRPRPKPQAGDKAFRSQAGRESSKPQEVIALPPLRKVTLTAAHLAQQQQVLRLQGRPFPWPRRTPLLLPPRVFGRGAPPPGVPLLHPAPRQQHTPPGSCSAGKELLRAEPQVEGSCCHSQGPTQVTLFTPRAPPRSHTLCTVQADHSRLLQAST
jgi:hypothetical protein